MRLSANSQMERLIDHNWTMWAPQVALHMILYADHFR